MDVAFRLGTDPRRGDQAVRGSVALPHGTVRLYRLTGLGISDRQRPEPSSPPSEPSHASCELRDGELVLRIRYFAGFTDKLRFSGDEVYKTGVFTSDGAQGAVHWFEELRHDPR